MRKEILSAVAVATAAAAFAVTAEVDFTEPVGRIKPLHGVNNAPMRIPEGSTQWEFKEAGIPFMRTHDTAGMWGGGHYVDIPNVFPDFDADENDPASYDFAFTDAYLKKIVAAGTRIYYRLGVTIENYYKIKAYNSRPPKDFAKWARICEHVVRHYTEGWADGYRWDVAYWEIWNEPENPPMWQGTREQFFELYRVTANHLKKCFPGIKVGGYGCCGFYALDGEGWQKSDFQKSFLKWFEDFCAYVTDEKTKAPLDFYSWHIYLLDSPRRIATHADYVRRTLDAAGLAATEIHLNEWNYVGPKWDDYEGMRMARGAACVGEAFCVMQGAPVDVSCYYDALPTRTYCGLFNLVGKDLRTTTYFAFPMWNTLYSLGTAVRCGASETNGFAVVAAADGARKAAFLVNNTAEPRMVNLSLKGATAGEFETYLLDDAVNSLRAGVPAKIDLTKPFELKPHMLALLKTPERAASAEKGTVKATFAGQDAK